MKFRHHLRMVPFFIVGLIGLGLAGCFATNSSNTNIAGRIIPDDVFTQVQPGKTRDFVVDLLGAPTTKMTEENGAEVWRWSYNETKTAAKTFMIFYVAVDRTHTIQTVAVAFKDGVVVKTWRE